MLTLAKLDYYRYFKMLIWKIKYILLKKFEQHYKVLPANLSNILSGSKARNTCFPSRLEFQRKYKFVTGSARKSSEQRPLLYTQYADVN